MTSTAIASASRSIVERLGLNDPRKFRRISRVPVLDVHEPIPKRVYDPSAVSRSNPTGIVERMLTVSAEDLAWIAANSNRLASAGRPPSLTLGHSPLDDRPESARPKHVGHVVNFEVGEHDGKPCLFADLFCQAAQYDESSTYPNLSVERVDWSDPKTHRVDAVALLRREPERSLPKVPYHSDRKPPRVLYGKELASPASTALQPGELVAYAQKIACFDPGEVHRRLLADRAFRTNYASDRRRMAIVEDVRPNAEDPAIRQKRIDFGTKHGIFDPTLLRAKFAQAMKDGLIV